MNTTAGFYEHVDDQSFEHHVVNCTSQRPPSPDDDAAAAAATSALYHIISHVVHALGIPGNLLSAIVWLRLLVSNDNPPAVLYLAALAVNDLVWLLADVVVPHVADCAGTVYWLCQSVSWLGFAGEAYDPLLVLGFSVARLVAVIRPLQVRTHARGGGGGRRVSKVCRRRGSSNLSLELHWLDSWTVLAPTLWW